MEGPRRLRPPRVSGPRVPPGSRRAVSPKLQEQLALCASFPERVLFLDIETTGLSHYYDEITIVGWTFGGTAKTLVKGQEPSSLVNDAGRAKVLVTFNGIRFDTKFIAKELPEVALPDTHIDLMYLCRRVGLKGGQKAIEKELDIRVRDDLAGVDGAAAVVLWHRYMRGDAAALQKLIRYNRADIAAMGEILDLTVPRFSFHPDLFLEETSFRDWSAPAGWLDLTIPTSTSAGRTGPPPPRFEDLFGGTAAEEARVVGIDLTGSEARGTGWCVLNGSIAETAVLFADDEILDETIRARPQLVSIDSPLCLPRGRTSVDDADPGRHEFGIMRESERELKRRGVNVYPCLIRSMQKLTARGIRLAETLRDRGIPVIESYPGAAQDIMRIPRKGAGPEWLKTGLRDFGVSGDYELQDVTHDELDAITSALVGTFHLAGMTEGIGYGRGATSHHSAASKGVGLDGSWSQWADRGRENDPRSCPGATGVRLYPIQPRAGRPAGRAGICPGIGSTARSSATRSTPAGRQRWLSARTVARVADADRIVIDGLRFPDDHAFMVERFGAGFRHVFIEAGADVRCSRYEDGDPDVSFDDASGALVERRVGEMRSLAHGVFVNQGDLSAVERWADQLAIRIDKR